MFWMTMAMLGCGSVTEVEAPPAPTEAAAMDCDQEPARPRCPASEGGRCAEMWAVVDAWEAACRPGGEPADTEPAPDCEHEVFPPKCIPGSSDLCDEGWAKTNAWRHACRGDEVDGD